MSAQITVDRIRCDGRGLCAELLPELIELDDWGYPVVAGGPVPAALMPLARQAVAACPVLALTLTVGGRGGQRAGLTAVSQPRHTAL